MSKNCCTFVAKSVKTININKNMNTLLKDLGAILVLLGVICLAVYYFGVQVNGLLVAALALQISGLFAYIFINKRLS
jgi:hypothetical protein